MSEEKNKEDKTPGKICWHELITSDTEGSKAFYSGLFGWTTEEMDILPNTPCSRMGMSRNPG